MNAPIAHIQTEHLTRQFGPVRALQKISLEIKAGDVVAVMGPNGAGKSTLLSILSLALRPSGGNLRFNGQSAEVSDAAFRSQIGLLSHQPLVYPDLTVRENLILFARLYHHPRPSDAALAMEAKMGLGAFATDRVTRVLSRGQLQRTSLARALISAPSLLLLDEPASGLDRDAVTRIQNAVRDLARAGGITVLVTHEPNIAAALANRAIMVDRGQVKADEPAPETRDGWRELYRSAVDPTSRRDPQTPRPAEGAP